MNLQNRIDNRWVPHPQGGFSLDGTTDKLHASISPGARPYALHEEPPLVIRAQVEHAKTR